MVLFPRESVYNAQH